MTIIVVVVLSILMIAGAMVLSVQRHRQLTGPLQRMRANVQKYTSGEFAIDNTGYHAFEDTAALARDLNEMAATLRSRYRGLETKVEQTSGELARSERLASVGRLAAGVAHEINNPLNIISGYAELGQKWLDGSPPADRLEASRDALDTIKGEAFRCKQIVEQLGSLSRVAYDGRDEVSLHHVVRDVIALIRGLERYRGRRVLFDPRSVPGVVLGNEAKLKQVVLNLMVNSLQAIDPETGLVFVGIEDAPDRWVRLTVADNGAGLSPDTQEKVFEPFFGTRKANKERGLGLGLTISHGIVEAHGGRLSVESEGPGQGCKFTVELPADG